jgi:membrane fusion protein (multidrug efflux system)
VDEAKATLQTAEARLGRAKASLDLAKAGPAKEKVEEARAEVLIAEAELAHARLQLDVMTLRAPFDGVVVLRATQKGEFVRDGTAICRVANLGNLEVTASVPETSLSRVVKGQECVVRLPALPDEKFKGSVARISPVVDNATGTVTIHIRLEDAGQKLRPGMFVRVAVTPKE